MYSPKSVLVTVGLVTSAAGVLIGGGCAGVPEREHRDGAATTAASLLFDELDEGADVSDGGEHESADAGHRESDDGDEADAGAARNRNREVEVEVEIEIEVANGSREADDDDD